MIAPVSIWVSLLSEVTTKHMKVSREGVILIKSFVGFRSKAVCDENGRWVIGYGHTASAREGLTVAEPDAELLLQYDLLPVVKGINQGVARPVNQHQFDALASFALSIGIDRFLGSDVLQRLNDGLPTQAADALIGWPTPVPIDTATRRRIAERALFNTDPDLPVHLADLLTAPLVASPAAAVEEPNTTVPPVAAVAARAAAVATLLGEPAGQADQPVSAPAAESPAAGVVEEAPSPTETGANESATPAPSPTDAPDSPPLAPAPVPVPGSMQFQRYSPYAAGIVGPLPGLTAVPATPTEPAPAPAAPATPNAAVTMSIRMAVAVEQTAAAETPVVADLVEQPSSADTTLPQTAQPEVAEPAPAVAPDDTVVTPFATFEPAPPAAPPLVLTAGSTETTPADDRPAWPEARRPDTTENQEPLFVEEPALSVLRHEIETETPARFEKSQTGAFLIMGGVGLLASAFSAAAFRLALEEPSPMGETTVVAWTLAVIGGVCVVVSSLNLYMRWGRTQQDGTEPS